jgi:hypothetical protein
LNAAALKAVRRRKASRGFESHPLRFLVADLAWWSGLRGGCQAAGQSGCLRLNPVIWVPHGATTVPRERRDRFYEAGECGQAMTKGLPSLAPTVDCSLVVSAENTDSEPERRGELARAGARIGSQSLGAYLGTIMGPEAGAAAGQALSEIAEGVVDRWQDRARERVARTLLQARAQIKGKEEGGEEIRSDLTDRNNEAAIALFESVIEAAAESAEQRKCEVIANLYASVASDPSISIEDALLYLSRVRDCSWRQLVALRYVEAEDRREERETIGAAGADGNARIHPALGAELSELARAQELIGIGQDGGSVANLSNVMNGGGITSGSATRLRATGLGETVSRLGRLGDLVTPEELDAITRDLRSDHRER